MIKRICCASSTLWFATTAIAASTVRVNNHNNYLHFVPMHSALSIWIYTHIFALTHDIATSVQVYAIPTLGSYTNYVRSKRKEKYFARISDSEQWIYFMCCVCVCACAMESFLLLLCKWFESNRITFFSLIKIHWLKQSPKPLYPVTDIN